MKGRCSVIEDDGTPCQRPVQLFKVGNHRLKSDPAKHSCAYHRVRRRTAEQRQRAAEKAAETRKARGK